MKYAAIALATLHIGASALVAAPNPAGTPKTNVLLIIADDLRTELGCYGARSIQSPNIDRLAARGLVFERAYCQVSVCNPSRNSLLSGARPDTTRSLDNRTFLRSTMPQVVTLPQHFKDHGWHTASVGKVFHHSEREPGDDPQSWSEPSWYHGEPHRHWFSAESLAFVERLKKLPAHERPKLIRAAPFEAADESEEAYPDAKTAAKAIETLRRLKDRQFFLGVGFVKPHLPFTCPRKYWDLYPPEGVKLPENCHPPKGAPAPALHDAYELRTYGTVPPTGDIPRELALNLVRGYRACVSFLDAQVGRVLDELDRLDLRENTIVVFLGDNGYHLGENGVFTKMTNFELGTRVPLILCIPKGLAAGRSTAALVELVDIYPTLARLCGLSLPPHLEGASLVPLIEKPERPWKTAAFSQYLRPGKVPIMGRSIRTDGWRYTEWTSKQGALVGVELYDHGVDPAENTNLASDASRRAIVEDLAQRLQGGWKMAMPSP